MGWQRARKPEQKAERRDAILNAARAMFRELAYEEISLNAIAREADFSKPNVYRYFSTREEIFLAIFEEELTRFTRALIKKLKGLRAKNHAAGIARAWIEVALKHRAFLDLLPLLSLSLERNSSVEQIVAFKKIGFGLFAELLQEHKRLYPRLGDKQWTVAMNCGISMMAGCWPLANPGDNVLEALRHPDVNQPAWDFEALMVPGLTALIKGTRNDGKRRA